MSKVFVMKTVKTGYITKNTEISLWKSTSRELEFYLTLVYPESIMFLYMHSVAKLY